jgi:hypothetical protein
LQEKSDAKKGLEKKGILIPGEKKLTYKQVNALLRGFPPN